MPTPLAHVVEGWTDALPFRLDADGAPVVLTGLTVQIVLKDCHNRVILDTSSGVTVTASTAGAVEWTPSSTAILTVERAPVKVRFRVTDSTSIVYFPNAEADVIKVHP